VKDMDSLYHSTVMQRPVEEDEEGVRRERMNGASNSNTYTRSPTKPDFRSPYSPTNSHPRPQFNDPYHPPTPAPLPMPTTSHIPGPPASPRTLAAPSTYGSEYQPTPRDKPTSNYYDPTSDSGDRRPAENTPWREAPSHTPQVRDGGDSYENSVAYQMANIILQSREPYVYPQAPSEPTKYYNGNYTSPVISTFPPRSPISHSHPQRISPSPRMTSVTSPVTRHNGVTMGGPVIKQESVAPAVVSIISPSMSLQI
jgi:DNA helicase INO80